MLKYKTSQPLSAKNLYPHNDTGAPKTGPCVTPNSVCDALERDGAPVLLVVGRFHGDFDGGTVARIQGMRPGIDVRYVVMVGSPSGPLRPEDRGRGDFVIYTDARRANE